MKLFGSPIGKALVSTSSVVSSDYFEADACPASPPLRQRWPGLREMTIVYGQVGLIEKRNCAVDHLGDRESGGDSDRV